METMKKVNKVEVYGDRTYYVVEIIDNKPSFKMLRTSALYEIIETLKELNRMHSNAILIACCYEQYNGGSFNVEVNPDEQYKEIYNYAKKKYKTFLSKAIEENITGTITHMSDEEILMEKLDKITKRIKKVNNILSDDDDDDREHWLEKLTKLEKEHEIILTQLQDIKGK
jgi:hypothetical protein